MNNKHASIELIDEMAKVKDDFKILPKDIIESMLEDMTAEEKDMLLRLYIFGILLISKPEAILTLNEGDLN